MKDSIPMPIIEQFCLEDKTPTERKIPLDKECYQTAVNIILDTAILASQSFSEGVSYCESKDRGLAKVLQEAQDACDRITAYLVNRTI